MTRPAKPPDRKRGRGRPPLPDSERVDQTILVRITPVERAAVAAAAAEQSLSAWVRDAIRERLGLDA